MDISGVLVHLKGSGFRGARKYRHYSVVPAELISCPYIWEIPLRLGLSLCITYKIYPPPIHNPRDGFELFFYSQRNPMLAYPLIVFRNDFKPLHPKQVQALWKFLLHLMRKFSPNSPSTISRSRWDGLPADLVSGDHHERLWALNEFWYDYCTVNNFSAFFDRLRHQKLEGGDESWRAVKSPYDE